MKERLKTLFNDFMKYIDDFFKYILDHIIASVIIFSIVFDSINAAWGENRPIADFFEQLIAGILSWGTTIGILIAPLYAIYLVEKFTKNGWLYFIAALLALILMMEIDDYVTHDIPGVSWRLKRIDD